MYAIPAYLWTHADDSPVPAVYARQECGNRATWISDNIRPRDYNTKSLRINCRLIDGTTLLKNSNISIAFLAISITACVTSSKAPTFANAPAPSQRSDMAILYVVRENAVPYAFPGDVDVEGQHAAHLAQKSYTWF